MSQTALVRSTDLFDVAKYLSGKNDKRFAKKCRNAILSSVGLVAFPIVPVQQTDGSEENVADTDE